ncbi:MAG: hypothetical protein C4532_02775 [Candidatus Abyssobacteria bacterium SURF_17]|uniref:Uncharacterized protein n=1 Tax=Candidatus Abyssobacteria bacterium SURF_17 TaxID=2093361 RepID=A0A419F7H4_9BACT|nr:MAG: hypothetical protein C4532_02775 [Candidatus Abyssubacteria bacterium SURF_17]
MNQVEQTCHSEKEGSVLLMTEILNFCRDLQSAVIASKGSQIRAKQSPYDGEIASSRGSATLRSSQ